MNEIKKEKQDVKTNAKSTTCCGLDATATASDTFKTNANSEPCTPTSVMKMTQFLKALYHRLTPPRYRETPAMNPLTNPATAQARKTQRAQRVLAKVRQRQLELALRGQVADSARYARRAQRVRCKAAQFDSMSTCCAA